MTSELSNWFRKKSFDWRYENPRSSDEDFAKLIGISKAYLSQLINGTNKGLSMKTAQKICENLNDWSLFDILGYPKPSKVDQLPESFRNRIEEASAEVERVFEERGLTGDSPEAEAIVIEIFERFGFKYTDTEI